MRPLVDGVLATPRGVSEVLLAPFSDHFGSLGSSRNSFWEALVLDDLLKGTRPGGGDAPPPLGTGWLGSAGQPRTVANPFLNVSRASSEE